MQFAVSAEQRVHKEEGLHGRLAERCCASRTKAYETLGILEGFLDNAFT